MKYSEKSIASALATQFFDRKFLVMVPNCGWTGDECDILAVTHHLRIIDIEIKISRADFKADAKKDKWVSRPYNWRFEIDGGFALHGAPAPKLPLEWPEKVWKHYYVMPSEIWTPELLPAAGSPSSGILLLHEHNGILGIECKRAAKANRQADKITPETAINLARLASLRMWSTLDRLQATGRAA
jgi:hypothetical protein